MVSIQPEFQLLFCCARTEIDSETRMQIERLASRVDWTAFVTLAENHRVQPLVHWSLSRTVPDLVPADVKDRLNRVFRSTALYNLSLTGELGWLQALLEEHGIPNICFKGPPLAQMVYRNLGLRICTDLDILVSGAAYDDAVGVLAEAGYMPAGHIRHLQGFRKRAYLYLSRQATFIRQRSLVVDLHVSLFPPGYYIGPDFATLYERSIRLEVGNVPVRTFQPEDLLLLLCFHGVKDRWEALKHYSDVAELLRIYPELDWDLVEARARESKARRVLLLGLSLAHDHLDAPLPERMLRQIRQDRQIPFLKEQMVAGLISNGRERLSPRERFRFHLHVRDSLATRARYLLYALARRLNSDWLPAEP